MGPLPSIQETSCLLCGGQSSQRYTSKSSSCTCSWGACPRPKDERRGVSRIVPQLDDLLFHRAIKPQYMWTYIAMGQASLKPKAWAATLVTCQGRLQGHDLLQACLLYSMLNRNQGHAGQLGKESPRNATLFEMADKREQSLDRASAPGFPFC